jgi:Lar family restriction alleviation protein
MENKDKELKPCPFCGSIDQLKQLVEMLEDNSTVEYVECWNCYAQGPVSLTEQGAIESWNQRGNK